MAFEALEVTLTLTRQLRGVVPVIQRADRDLASQLSRAVSSVALNLSEGRCRAGRDRTHGYRIAAGSADEARTALRRGLGVRRLRADEGASRDTRPSSRDALEAHALSRERIPGTGDTSFAVAAIQKFFSRPIWSGAKAA